MKLNLFRVSFDQPLSAREVRRGRLAAALLTICGTGVVVTGAWAVLNMSSDVIGDFTNAKPDPKVRVVGTSVENGTPCRDQTWPHIEARCVKPADPKSAERSTPKRGLGSQNAALPTASATAGDAQAMPAPERGTTGSASADNPGPKSAPTPEESQPSRSASGMARPDAARQRQEAGKSRGEARQQRARVRRDRRETARFSRPQRPRTNAADVERSTRSDAERLPWNRTEYSYRSPDGSSHRVIVIRRGFFGDDFF